MDGGGGGWAGIRLFLVACLPMGFLLNDGPMFLYVYMECAAGLYTTGQGQGPPIKTHRYSDQNQRRFIRRLYSFLPQSGS